jgi:ribosomal protein S6--L-glutamate ligase
MRLLSFNPYRTLGLPGVSYLKPEQMLSQGDTVLAADAVLFPQAWQLNVLCYVWRRHVFPSPATYDLGYDKVEMTRAFQALAPNHVPHTLIVPPSDTGIRQALDELGLPLVAKEPRNSMGRGVALIETAAKLRDWAARVDVLYVQEYLQADADLRVVWVGDRVLSAYWRRGGDGFHHNIARGGAADFDAIPLPALNLVRDVATGLGVDHAGFDIMMIDGHPWVLEFNTLFGNEALNRLGIRVEPAILDYLQHTVPIRQDPEKSSQVTA